MPPRNLPRSALLLLLLLLVLLSLSTALRVARTTRREEPEQKDDIPIPVQQDQMSVDERIADMFKKKRKPRRRQPKPKFAAAAAAAAAAKEDGPSTVVDAAVESLPLPPPAGDERCVSIGACKEGCRKEITNAAGKSWRLAQGPSVDMCQIGCCMRSGKAYKDCSRECWKFVKFDGGDNGGSYRECYRGCDHRCRNFLLSVGPQGQSCEKALQVMINQKVSPIEEKLFPKEDLDVR
jgi:hypothetical protein